MKAVAFPRHTPHFVISTHYIILFKRQAGRQAASGKMKCWSIETQWMWRVCQERKTGLKSRIFKPSETPFRLFINLNLFSGQESMSSHNKHMLRINNSCCCNKVVHCKLDQVLKCFSFSLVCTFPSFSPNQQSQEFFVLLRAGIQKSKSFCSLWQLKNLIYLVIMETKIYIFFWRISPTFRF